MSKLSVPVSKDDHVLGAMDAPITLVEYGDYQCPFCAAAQPRVQRLIAKFGNDLRFVYRHFPLTQAHEFAALAAMTAESAGLQGKFWQMHESLYKNQAIFGLDGFRRIAQRLDIDIDAFQEHLSDEILAAKIQQNFLGGLRSGVNGTPSFYLNNEKINALPDVDSLKSMFDAADELL